MRTVIMVLVLAACGETRQIQRWPEHRRRGDERMNVLEEKVRVLELKLAAVVKELQRRPAAPADVQPAPAAVPSPSP